MAEIHRLATDPNHHIVKAPPVARALSVAGRVAWVHPSRMPDDTRQKEVTV